MAAEVTAKLWFAHNNVECSNRQIENGNEEFVETEKSRCELEIAEQEWNSVPTIIPTVIPNNGLLHINRKSSDRNIRNSVPIINFDESWAYFQKADLSAYIDKIKPTVEKHGMSSVIHNIFGPPRIHSSLIQDRNLIFKIAMSPMNHSDPVHIRVLQTIYKKLTSTVLDCPLFGPHWEQIGFQGKDPATDLRGVGFLGLLHPLYLVTSGHLLPLAQAVYKLSLDPQQNFPFMVLSLNVTGIVLQVFREGFLNKECNSHTNISSVVNQFYAAVLYHIYWIWHLQHKTIEDSGFVLRDARLYCKRNVRAALRSVNQFLQSKGSGNITKDNQKQKTNKRTNNKKGKWKAPQDSLEHLQMQAKSEVFI